MNSIAPSSNLKTKLLSRIAAAQKQADVAKKTAKLAKAGYKAAKLKLKETKRAAKKLRKGLKALKAELAVLTAKQKPARKPAAKRAAKRVRPATAGIAVPAAARENAPAVIAPVIESAAPVQ